MRAVISGAGTRVPPEGHDSEWLPASKVSHPPTSRQACRTNDHWSALHASKSTQPDKVTKILNLNLLWQVLPLTIRTNHIQGIMPCGILFSLFTFKTVNCHHLTIQRKEGLYLDVKQIIDLG